MVEANQRQTIEGNIYLQLSNAENDGFPGKHHEPGTAS